MTTIDTTIDLDGAVWLTAKAARLLGHDVPANLADDEAVHYGPDREALQLIVQGLTNPPFFAYYEWRKTGSGPSTDRLEQWSALVRKARVLVGLCPTCGSDSPDHTDAVWYQRRGRECRDVFHAEADGG